MIAKSAKGSGFRGAAEYDLSKGGGHVIGTNMAGSTPRELAAEFGKVRALRPKLGKAVLHVSLSAAPGERLSDEQWKKAGEKYLAGMGFDNNQFIITRHADTEHEHVHILANRIRNDGSVVSDSQDYKRQEVIMREIEHELGLQTVAPSREAQRKAPAKAEIEAHQRTGQPSARQQLQQLCDAAVKDCNGFTEYVQRLEAAGVDVIPTVQQSGAKLTGLQYRLGGVTMKGSDLGKTYAAQGIQQRGATYEKDRDAEAVRRAIERDARYKFGRADRGSEAGQAPERGGLGRDVGAAGPSNGGALGRNERDAETYTGTQHREKRVFSGSTEKASRYLEISGQGSQGGIGGSEELAGILRDQDHGSLSIERTDSIDSIGRIGALAGIAPRQGKDRTLIAVKSQIEALGVDQIEIGIRDQQTGKMMNKQWSREELIENIGWLKRLNARGNHIYVRPSAESGLVLVDDLKMESIAQMKRDGLGAAAVIETSPGNYQAWVKMSDKPLPPEMRLVISRNIAHKYGGDMNSVKAKQYGRLSGFTNPKPEYSKNGRQPYSLLHESSGKVAEVAPVVIDRVQKFIDEKVIEQTRQTRLDAIQSHPRTASRTAWNDAKAYYKQKAQEALQEHGGDLSRLDWNVSVEMAKAGFSAGAIAEAIKECSPNIESRKAGHLEDYATRTAEKAAKYAATIMPAPRQTHDHSHDLGMDM